MPWTQAETRMPCACAQPDFSPALEAAMIVLQASQLTAHRSSLLKLIRVQRWGLQSILS